MASNFQNKEEKVIVLFGECGVGKSTFINAIYNYTLYDSIEEAEQNDLKYLIPIVVTLTDADFNRVVVKIGNDRNEKDGFGRAATQEAKIRRLKLKNNTTICLIDTPGVGDPDGCERDKQNIESTFRLLENFNQVHGICILMKPNNARLDLHFRYCFKELMINLHKKAAPNIVFCFTHSKGTAFKPGDTFQALQILLKKVEVESGINIPFGKDNIFCLDNEGIRYLAGKQSGVKFDVEEEKNFSTSWDISTKTAQNMLKYIFNLADFEVRPNLNECRNLVTALSKPIADISQNIQTNLKLANDKKAEMNSIDPTEIDNLKSKLYLEQIDLKRKRLKHPRTVCTDPSCTRTVNIGGVNKVDYFTHCHEPCYDLTCATDTINNEALKKCQAMYEGYCKRCDHHYLKHMHITYEYEEKSVKVIDENVEKMINSKEERKQLIEKFIESTNRMIEQLQQEQEKIIESSSQLAAFVKQNSIMVFNDDFEEYLDLLIKEEINKKQAGAKNGQIVQGLRQFKESYVEQKKIFDRALKRSKGTKDINDIENLLEDLYALPLNGDKIREVIEALRNKKIKFTRKRQNKRKKVLNVLLFGESGVGKSTFVNAFFNYMHFSTLEEAENKPNISCKVPSSFIYMDEHYNKHIVEIGEADENECQIEGQSSTQNAKSHSLETDDLIINIIDTPGMGDTRGIDKDQENFRNTIQYLSKYEYLNAICILIKPNNSKFNPAFKYCLKELLPGLHKDFVQNILFCFTNTGMTYYRPDQSLPLLQSFLEEIERISNVSIPLNRKNFFCFDNEAFRYLVIAKNGHELPFDERRRYEFSWEKSSSESKRMLAYLLDIAVMPTKNLVSLVRSKCFSMYWSRRTVDTLFEISRLLSSNYCETDYEKEELDSLRKKIILKSSALTCFIKNNTLSVFNDQLDAHLLESMESIKESSAKNSKILLKEMKQVYIEYKTSLNDEDGKIRDENDFKKYEKDLNDYIHKTNKIIQKIIMR